MSYSNKRTFFEIMIMIIMMVSSVLLLLDYPDVNGQLVTIVAKHLNLLKVSTLEYGGRFETALLYL